MRERRNARDETRRDARTSAVADMVDGVWGRVRDEKSAVFSKTINLHVRIHTNALYSTPPSLKRVVSLSHLLARFPSPFFGGPFPRLRRRSSFTLRLVSSGAVNNGSLLASDFG